MSGSALIRGPCVKPRYRFTFCAWQAYVSHSDVSIPPLPVEYRLSRTTSTDYTDTVTIYSTRFKMPLSVSQKYSGWIQVLERVGNPTVYGISTKYGLLYSPREYKTFIWSKLVLEMKRFFRDL
jgi:hypothetical protein